MSNLELENEITALLVIDPYNDFISEGGKAWDRLKAVAEANQCVPHVLQVLDAARRADIRVFYVLHRRYSAGTTRRSNMLLQFRRRPGTEKLSNTAHGGAEIRLELKPAPGDIAVSEHWCSGGFANTDFGFAAQKAWNS